jgi:hypothetical protein
MNKDAAKREAERSAERHSQQAYYDPVTENWFYGRDAQLMRQFRQRRFPTRRRSSAEQFGYRITGTKMWVVMALCIGFFIWAIVRVILVSRLFR